MKTLSRSLSTVAIGLLACGTLWGQSLADAAARAQQQQKPPAGPVKVYTNESAEFHGASPDATTRSDSDAKSDNGDAASANKTDASSEDPAAAEAKKAAEAKELQDKVTKQTEEITQLKRELDVLQRENRMRAAIFYSDAAARLQNEQKYTDDDRKYQADIANKQKAISDAQANLEKLREEARRAGVRVE